MAALEDVPDIPIPVPKNPALSDGAQPTEAQVATFTGPVRTGIYALRDAIANAELGEPSLADAMTRAHVNDYLNVLNPPPGSGLTPLVGDGNAENMTDLEAIRTYAARGTRRQPLYWPVPPSGLAYKMGAVIVPAFGEAWFGSPQKDTGWGPGHRIDAATGAHLFSMPEELGAFSLTGLRIQLTAGKCLFENQNLSTGHLVRYSNIEGCFITGGSAVINGPIQCCRILYNSFHSQTDYQINTSGSDCHFEDNHGDSPYISSPNGKYLWQFTSMSRTTLYRNFLTGQKNGMLYVNGGRGLRLLGNEFDGFGNELPYGSGNFQELGEFSTQSSGLHLENTQCTLMHGNTIANVAKGTYDTGTDSPTFTGYNPSYSNAGVLVLNCQGLRMSGNIIENVGDRDATDNQPSVKLFGSSAGQCTDIRISDNTHIAASSAVTIFGTAANVTQAYVNGALISTT